MMMRRKRVDPFIPIKSTKRTHLSQTARPAPQAQGRQYLLKRHGGQVVPTSDIVIKQRRPTLGRHPSLHLTKRRKTKVISDVMPSAPRTHLQGERVRRVERIRRIRRLRRLGIEVLIVLKRAEEREEVKKVRTWPMAVQGTLLILGAVSVGLFIETLLFGEIIIGIYGVFALVRRLPSRTTFVLALIALGSVVLLLLARGGETDLSDNFAVYAFLLLVVGTISLGAEVRREAKQ